jgi:hypothetical protein
MSGSRGFAYAWRSLMVGQPIVTPEGKPIEYSVGQPMGARSSWIIFTLSHHLILQYSAFLAGEYPTRKYIMLGDDIVITNDKIASHYKEVIKSLGVEISESKSHVSLTTYEFAKRWFHNGIEISGIPLKGLISSIENRDFLNLFNIMQSLLEKGYYTVKEDTVSFVVS